MILEAKKTVQNIRPHYSSIKTSVLDTHNVHGNVEFQKHTHYCSGFAAILMMVSYTHLTAAVGHREEVNRTVDGHFAEFNVVQSKVLQQTRRQ